MVNPHDPNSAQWKAWERAQGERGTPTNTWESQNAYNQSQQNRGGGGGGGGGGCFPAGVMIRTPQGDRPIETIEAGDVVWARRAGSADVAPARVLKRKDHAPNAITMITFEDGSSLRSTMAHSFLTDRGWRSVRALRIGDRLAAECETRTVASISTLAQKESVYNLVTEKHFTFFADGVLAHNFTWFRAAKGYAWSVRAFIARKASRPRSVARRKAPASA